MITSASPAMRLIATGGTFDKHYDAIKGELIFTRSRLPQIIQRVRLTLPTVVEELPLLDSLEMQDSDRERVLQACCAAPERALVIVHGTDTMTTTAQYLQRAAVPKTIVLTGAMIPYETDGSDALFNLGFACACGQTLPDGVYVTMNGRIFDAQHVQKNRHAGVFEISPPRAAEAESIETRQQPRRQ